MKNNYSLESRILRVHERVERLERDLAQAAGSRATVEERLSECEKSVGLVSQAVSGIPPGQSSTVRPPAVVLDDLLPAENARGHRAAIRDGLSGTSAV
jgi:hypothetical protein